MRAARFTILIGAGLAGLGLMFGVAAISGSVPAGGYISLNFIIGIILIFVGRAKYKKAKRIEDHIQREREETAQRNR